MPQSTWCILLEIRSQKYGMFVRHTLCPRGSLGGSVGIQSNHSRPSRLTGKESPLLGGDGDDFLRAPIAGRRRNSSKSLRRRGDFVGRVIASSVCTMICGTALMTSCNRRFPAAGRRGSIQRSEDRCQSKKLSQRRTRLGSRPNSLLSAHYYLMERTIIRQRRSMNRHVRGERVPR
jgi:hypothetical protein